MLEIKLVFVVRLPILLYYCLTARSNSHPLCISLVTYSLTWMRSYTWIGFANTQRKDTGSVLGTGIQNGGISQSDLVCSRILSCDCIQNGIPRSDYCHPCIMSHCIHQYLSGGRPTTCPRTDRRRSSAFVNDDPSSHGCKYHHLASPMPKVAGRLENLTWCISFLMKLNFIDSGCVPCCASIKSYPWRPSWSLCSFQVGLPLDWNSLWSCENWLSRAQKSR